MTISTKRGDEGFPLTDEDEKILDRIWSSQKTPSRGNKMHSACPNCGSRIISTKSIDSKGIETKACHSCGENFHKSGGGGGKGGGLGAPMNATQVVEHLSKSSGSDITVAEFSGFEGQKKLDLQLHDTKYTTFGKAVNEAEKLNGWKVLEGEPGRVVLQQIPPPKPAAPTVKPLSSISEVKSIIRTEGGVPTSAISVTKTGKGTLISFPKHTPNFQQIQDQVLSKTNAPGSKFILERGDPVSPFGPHQVPGKKSFLLRER